MGVNGGTPTSNSPTSNTEAIPNELSGPLLKWFSALLLLFPKAHRQSVGHELLADLALRPTWSTRSVLSESLALIRAGMSISVRSAHEQRPFAHVANGAALWLGLLVAVGPISRLGLMHYQTGRLETQFGIFRPWTSLSIMVFVGVLVALRVRSSGAMAIAIPILVICTGLSTAQGTWAPSDAIAYEVLWLGPPLAILTLASLRERGGHPRLTVAALLVTLALGLQVSTSTLSLLSTRSTSFGGRLYSGGITELITPSLAIVAIATWFTIGILKPKFLLMTVVPISQLVLLAAV